MKKYKFALTRFDFLSKIWLFLILLLGAIPNKGISQVNQQTGSAVFDVPVFNYQDNVSNLSLPISLGYNSGYGLKVDEVATDVGQGWGLMAGGKIVRVQVGEPDDQKANGGEGAEVSTSIVKYPAGYLFTNQNPALGAPSNYPAYPIFPGKNQLYRQHNILNADRELDYFMLNVNGISATFVLKKGTNEGVFLGSSLMKVSFQTVAGNTQPFSTPVASGVARTVIKGFTVTDGNGIQYVFETLAFTKMQRQAPCDRSFSTKVEPPKKYKNSKVYHETFFDDPGIENPYIVNEWHLTRIIDNFIGNTRKIEFTYNYRHLLNTWTGFDYQRIDAKKDYGKVVARRATILVPVINAVSCPNNYQITFLYGIPRLDLPGSERLQSITVIYNNRILHRHLLKHSYVIYTRYGTPVTEEQKLASRLYLLGVTKQTAELKDEEKPYVFDYFLGGANKTEFVPPPFFTSKDIWGYYDGYYSLLGSDAANVSNINANLKSYCVNSSRGRSYRAFPTYNRIKKLTFYDRGNFDLGAAPYPLVKTGYAKLGLLKTIQYPTGGKLEFDYEQNRAKYFTEQTEGEVGGVHVNKTLQHDAVYDANCVPVNGVQTLYNYKNEDGSSSLWGVERPKNDFGISSDYRVFDKKVRLRFPFGIKCVYGFQYPGIMYSDQATGVSGYQQFMSSSVGQAASAALSVYATISNIVKIVNTASAATKSSVVLAWIGAALDVLMAIFEGIYTCLVQDDIKNSFVRTHYNQNLKGSNPLPMLYKRVELLQSQGGNGKVINEYTSNEDYPIWELDNPLFNMRQRYGIWQYGLLKRTVVLDANQKKQKEVINIYNDSCTYNPIALTNVAAEPSFAMRSGPSAEFDESSGLLAPSKICNFRKVPLGMPSCNIQTRKSVPVKSTDWATFNTSLTHIDSSTQDMQIGLYDVYSGKMELKSTIEKNYQQDDDSKFNTTTTNYTYYDVYAGQPDIMLPYETEEVSSSGAYTKKIVTYNSKYSGGETGTALNALTKLLDNGVLTIPVKVETQVKNLNKGIPNYLSTGEERTEFTITAPGSVQPAATFLRRVSSPVSNISLVSPVQTSAYQYNASGQMTGQSDEGGRTIRYLLDYDGQMQVATIVNIQSVDAVAYNSFETTEKHGFQFTGLANTGTCITGSQYYPLTPSQPITSNFTALAKPYILSFWATTAVTVTNATQTKSAPVRKGYTYYEYEVNTGVVSISISGNAGIDEIRFLPKAARMSTVTYDPIVGKTSECDASNRFVAFEYDTRGRLKLVRNDMNEIVKMYEYNEKNKAGQCPATYQSHAVYEIAQRNNCGAGYVGGYAEFTLAAGAYTSLISQEHADMLAQLAVDAQLQQYANINGACELLYTSPQRSGTFYNSNCANNQAPLAYTYTVPAGKYTSTISQEDADDQADEDMAEYGQDMADLYGGCTTSSTPLWESDVNPQMRCNNGATEVQMRDVNPNSSSYNQTQWMSQQSNTLGCTNPPIFILGRNYSNSSYQIEIIPTGSNLLYYSFSLSGLAIHTSPNTIVLPSGLYHIRVTPLSGSFNGYSWTATADNTNVFYQTGTYSSSMIYNVQINSSIHIELY